MQDMYGTTVRNPVRHAACAACTACGMSLAPSHAESHRHTDADTQHDTDTFCALRSRLSTAGVLRGIRGETEARRATGQ